MLENGYFVKENIVCLALNIGMGNADVVSERRLFLTESKNMFTLKCRYMCEEGYLHQRFF